MGSGNYSLRVTVDTGDIIDADVRNQEHQNHINNCNPQGVAAISDDTTDYLATKKPDIAERPLSNGEDGKNFRYQFDKIIGESSWIDEPVKSISEISTTLETTETGLHDHDHSEEPYKQIPTAGIEDKAVTPEKLSFDIKNLFQRLQFDVPFYYSEPDPASSLIASDLSDVPPLDETKGKEFFRCPFTPVANPSVIKIDYQLMFYPTEYDILNCLWVTIYDTVLETYEIIDTALQVTLHSGRYMSLTRTATLANLNLNPKEIIFRWGIYGNILAFDDGWTSRSACEMCINGGRISNINPLVEQKLNMKSNVWLEEIAIDAS